MQGIESKTHCQTINQWLIKKTWDNKIEKDDPKSHLTSLTQFHVLKQKKSVLSRSI